MAAITNADVAWTATFDGYAPVLNDRARSAEAALPTADLLAMLDDPQAFVVAHVLLTRRAGERYATFPEWNGLALEVGTDGAVTIDASQQPALARRWRSR